MKTGMWRSGILANLFEDRPKTLLSVRHRAIAAIDWEIQRSSLPIVNLQKSVDRGHSLLQSAHALKQLALPYKGMHDKREVAVTSGVFFDKAIPKDGGFRILGL